LGLEILAPQPHTFSFEDCWEQVDKAVAAPTTKGLSSMIILMDWSIWNHRNHCVSDGQQPTLSAILSAFQEDFTPVGIGWGSRSGSSPRPQPPVISLFPR
jgi:hypothetical protein